MNEEEKDTITFFKVKESLKKSKDLSSGSLYFVYAQIIANIFQYFDYGVFISSKEENFLDQSIQSELLKLMNECLLKMNIILPDIVELDEHGLEELKEKGLTAIQIKESFWDIPVPQRTAMSSPSPLQPSNIINEVLIPRSRLSIAFCQLVFCFRILHRDLRALNRSSSKTKSNAGYLDSLSKKIEELQRLKEKNDLLMSSRSQAKSLEFFELSPESIAQQLTLILFNAYKRIRENELHEIAWMKLDNPAINAHAFINLSTFFSRLFTFQAIHHSNPVQSASFLISICRHLHRLDNYQGIWIILQSFKSLKLEGLPKSDLVTLENLHNLLSSNRNYIIYRNHMKNKSKAIPLFAVLYDDLRAVDVGLLTSNHAINAISKFIYYQNIKDYEEIQADNSIQHWLLNKNDLYIDDETEQQSPKNDNNQTILSVNNEEEENQKDRFKPLFKQLRVKI